MFFSEIGTIKNSCKKLKKQLILKYLNIASFKIPTAWDLNNRN